MVSTDIPLIGCGTGLYEFGDKAPIVRSSTKGVWIDFAINSSDQLGVFECDFEFSKKPIKLSTFLEFLENQGEINVCLGNHTITRTEEDGRRIFTIKPNSDAVYHMAILRRPRVSAGVAVAWIDTQIMVQGFSCQPY